MSHFKNIWARMVSIAFYSDLHGTRFIIGSTEIACATLLLFVGNTLDFPSYQIMREIMSDKAWAFLFLLMGMTQFTILANGNYHSGFAVWFAAINQSVWWFMLISMLVSYPYPPLAFAAYVSVAMASTLVWIRSGQNTLSRRHNGT